MSNTTDIPSSLKAVAYIRVSTGKQKDKFSEDVQKNEIQKYADTHKPPLSVVETFEESRSGFRLKARVRFYDMLDFVHDNNIGHILYYMTSRASRNDLDWAALKSLRVRLHNVTSGRAFTPGLKADRRIKNQEDAEAVKAESESINTSDLVTAAQAEKVERGEYPGSPPLGYLCEPIMVDGKPLIVKGEIKNRTIVDPVQGPLMKKMFELCASGEARSLRDLNSIMKNLGQRSRTGRILTLEEVRRYLRTPFYYGWFKWGGKLYSNKGTYEPIISKVLFDEVQEVLDGRRIFTKRGRDFKYKDLLTCDFCGCKLVGDLHEKKNRKTGEKRPLIYYRCTGGKRTEWYQEHYKLPKCPLYYGPYYKEEDIDHFFEFGIGTLYVDPDTYDWVRSQLEEDAKNLKTLNAQEITALKKERAHNETTSANLAEAVGNTRNERARAVYEKKIDGLELRNAEIEARLEELEKGEEAVSLDEINEVLELSKALKDNYLAATPEKRAMLNKLMFRTVRITKEGYTPATEDDDPYLTEAPFYFVWEEPFKSLWEIGFIQGMSEAEVEEREEEKATKSAEIKEWRGRRDSNSRPPA